MPRSLAHRLRAAQRGGAILAVKDDQTVTVTWDQHGQHDPAPWLGTDDNRYASLDLIPIRPEGVQLSPLREARLKLGPMGRMARGEHPYLEGDRF